MNDVNQMNDATSHVSFPGLGVTIIWTIFQCEGKWPMRIVELNTAA